MNKKEVLKTGGIATAGIIIGLTITIVASSSFSLEAYESDYNEKVTMLKKAQLELCISERSLAIAKLEDYLTNQNKYSQADLDRITKKSKVTCGNEEAKTVVTETKTVVVEEKALDMQKLAYAVAMAETNDCTKESGITKNNCFGIMEWDENGKRYIKYHNSKEESYADFIDIWSRLYKVYPTIAEAKRWTGDDNAKTWLKNVNFYYNK